MFCNNCGHRNPADANFCSSCGSPLAHGTETTISFLPHDPSGEQGEEELNVAIGELATGAGMLVVKRGPSVGARYVLDKEQVLVGRHPDSEIFLDDITVSRRHAEFSCKEGIYTVRDAGSLNGTYVNRQRIDEATLSSGDEVQIGKFKLLFLSTGPK
ncbi:MAG: FHA domain-containing protein [Acidimicrobiales bacterium]